MERRKMTVLARSVVQTIEAMEQYFRSGTRWGRFSLHNPLNGNKCLLGAVQSVRLSTGNGASQVPSEEIAAATQCIQRAVAERGWKSIPDFNDSRIFYSQIQQVLNRAKQLAMVTYRQTPPAPVAEIPAPARAPQFLPSSPVTQAFAARPAPTPLPLPLPPPPPPSPLRALAHQPETAMSDHLWPGARQPDPARARRA
jgi:hypothetical protein